MIDIKITLELHAKWLLDEPDGSRANLSRANLSGANLSRANLSRANLSRANLSRANLSRANLSGADLSRANLSRANLSGADLSRADLSRANLSGADLYGANLSGADLYGANLSGADLYGADLSRAQGIIMFGPIGAELRIGFAVAGEAGVMVKLGCFWGAAADAVNAIVTKYGADTEDAKVYAALVSAACRAVGREWAAA